MHHYLTTSILLLAGVMLGGCSSTPTPNPDAMQYCYTEETVDIQNNNINSSTLVQCSDDPAKRAKYVGVDPKSCRSWNRTINTGGRTKEVYGFLCKDENGNFRPLDQF